jgi:hypothetical protein
MPSSLRSKLAWRKLTAETSSPSALLLLRRTKYQVYYRVSGETLEVLGVWHAARGEGPGL